VSIRTEVRSSGLNCQSFTKSIHPRSEPGCVGWSAGYGHKSRHDSRRARPEIPHPAPLLAAAMRVRREPAVRSVADDRGRARHLITDVENGIVHIELAGDLLTERFKVFSTLPRGRSVFFGACRPPINLLLRLWWGRIRNVHRDMPRTRIIDGCDTGMSARPVREHEIEIIPDDVPVLVGVQKIERYLGRLFHLVGKCLLDFRLAFQHAQNTTTKEGASLARCAAISCQPTTTWRMRRLIPPRSIRPKSRNWEGCRRLDARIRAEPKT
jgi:hypothetical protein